MPTAIDGTPQVACRVEERLDHAPPAAGAPDAADHRRGQLEVVGRHGPPLGNLARPHAEAAVRDLDLALRADRPRTGGNTGCRRPPSPGSPRPTGVSPPRRRPADRATRERSPHSLPPLSGQRTNACCPSKQRGLFGRAQPMLLVDPFGQAAFGPVNQRFGLPALARQVTQFADRLKAVHASPVSRLHDRLKAALDGAVGESFVQAAHLR